MRDNQIACLELAAAGAPCFFLNLELDDFDWPAWTSIKGVDFGLFLLRSPLNRSRRSPLARGRWQGWPDDEEWLAHHHHPHHHHHHKQQHFPISFYQSHLFWPWLPANPDCAENWKLENSEKQKRNEKIPFFWFNLLLHLWSSGYHWECTWREDGDRSSRAGSVNLLLLIVMMITLVMIWTLYDSFNDDDDDELTRGSRLVGWLDNRRDGVRGSCSIHQRIQ